MIRSLRVSIKVDYSSISNHQSSVMTSAFSISVFVLLGAINVAASGIYHHDDGWHQPHHLDHDAHGHDGEWGSKHGDDWGADHADAHDHGHEAGYKKGDEQDWARLDYGGHKQHASGDSYAHGFANEHGDEEGGDHGWAGGHDHGHSGHSAHHHAPHHLEHHDHLDHHLGHELDHDLDHGYFPYHGHRLGHHDWN